MSLQSVFAPAAVLYEAGKPLVIEEVEVRPPQAGEVRVRMKAAGVCHSDLHVMTGDLRMPEPIILGHEGAGTVERTGASVTRLAPGDKVVLTYDACGTCPACSSRRPAYCAEFALRNSSGTRPIMVVATVISLGRTRCTEPSSVASTTSSNVRMRPSRFHFR